MRPWPKFVENGVNMKETSKMIRKLRLQINQTNYILVMVLQCQCIFNYKFFFNSVYFARIRSFWPSLTATAGPLNHSDELMGKLFLSERRFWLWKRMDHSFRVSLGSKDVRTVRRRRASMAASSSRRCHMYE